MTLGRHLVAAAVGLALGASCATAPVRPTITPETEEFAFPRWPPGEVRPQEARAIERAWHELLAGDTARAEKRLRKVLADSPGLIPAEIALAYARLRAGAHADAVRGFASVLERKPDNVSALVGSGMPIRRTRRPSCPQTLCALRLRRERRSYFYPAPKQAALR